MCDRSVETSNLTVATQVIAGGSDSDELPHQLLRVGAPRVREDQGEEPGAGANEVHVLVCDVEHPHWNRLVETGLDLGLTWNGLTGRPLVLYWAWCIPVRWSRNQVMHPCWLEVRRVLMG